MKALTRVAAALTLVIAFPLACSPALTPWVPPPIASVAVKPSASSSKNPFPQRDIVKTRIAEVSDTYHGDVVVDPYRWLEDGTSKEVEAWTEAENAHTRAILDGDPRRAKLHARLDQLLQIGFVGSPVVRTQRDPKDPKKKITRYFHVRREGKMDQPVVFVREGLEGKDRALLDPTTFSSDNTTALDWWFVSNDGRRVVYGVSSSGDEQSTLHVREVETGKDLSEAIPRTRASHVAWYPDGNRFVYVRLPEPGSVPKGEESYHRKIYEHVIGTDWKGDPLIFGDALAMTDWPAPMLSPSGKTMAIYVGHGPAKSSVFVKDLAQKDAKFVAVVDGPDALFMPLPHTLPGPGGKDVVYLRSNDGAPNFQLFSIDPKKPEQKAWRLVVRESASPLRDFEAVGDSLYVGYLDRAHSRIERRKADGTLVNTIALPPLSSASVPHGEWDGDEALFEVQSYVLPPQILRVVPPAKEKKKGTTVDALPTEVFSKIDQSTIDTSQFDVQQIEATSKDGTKVTAFVVAKKGLALDGKSPATLYGYGGFNLVQTPAFNRTVYAFLERGGVYVVSNLRGGGEYGEAWHRGGMLGKKQNTFDDQIAVAERLIELGWTSKERLAIQGGSNGGLLVGALITQRPDLFRAVICAVPLIDMLRYQNFLLAKLWVPEYGSSDDPAQYAWLKAYSPYQKVEDGTAYPSTLILTGASDSRVDPLHARKFAARLQAATSSDRPILLRVETKAGHGIGKPRSKQLEELSDQYTFLFAQLGLEP
jgi:prolyl oligopeptidase